MCPGMAVDSTKGRFAAFVDEPGTEVNHAWFRGGWWDPLTLAWKDVTDAKMQPREFAAHAALGAGGPGTTA